MLETYLEARGPRWVPGRLTRTGDHLTFRPRRSRVVVRMTLDLRSVTLVALTPGRFVSTVSVRTSTHLLHLRARSSWVTELVDRLAEHLVEPVRDDEPAESQRPVAAWLDRRAG